jgi:CBS domain-containing protein
MVADPRVLAAAAPLCEAAELLTRPNVHSVLVVDADRLVGCITTDAIVEAVARGHDVRALTARAVADPDVTTIAPDEPLDDALRVMVERDLDRIAVTVDGRLLGVLPREPLLRRIAEDELTPGGTAPLAPA